MDISSILCDPITKNPLTLSEDELHSGDVRYPVINNIPVLLGNKEDCNKAVEILKNQKNKVGFSWALSHWGDLKINELLQTPNSEGELLLNFGSGSPLEKEKMTEKGYKVISIDINAGYSGVDIIADGHLLPLKSETFEMVTAFEVLEHLHEPWTAIKEINRVLKMGGKFVGSVAFLKEFHHSYFHMSYMGVKKLLEYGGFEVEIIYGGQNIFSRLVHNIIPLGPSKVSKKIYDKLNALIMFLRKKFWQTKTGIKYDKPIDRFDSEYYFSFEEYEKIMFAPTVLFRARKIKNL
jgi:SAM-dependent methyltransferase